MSSAETTSYCQLPNHCVAVEENWNDLTLNGGRNS